MTDLVMIFSDLKSELTVFSPPLTAKNCSEQRFELWSVKDMIIEGRKRKEIYFAGIITQKDYVGFYFMPVYVDSEIKQVFSPELLCLLKGKSCFHIKSMDEKILTEIRAALKTGFDLYLQRGWV